MARQRSACQSAAAALLGCASIASAQPFPAGTMLILAGSCDGSQSQTFTVPAGTGQIKHQQSGLCVEAWLGSDYAWQSGLKLQACTTNNLQQWTVDTVGNTLRSNFTPIVGCVGWTSGGGIMRPSDCASDQQFTITGTAPTQAIQSVGSQSCVAAVAPTASYTIDDTVASAMAGSFYGIGLTAASASSRLLIDYSDPARSNILNLLFNPGKQNSGVDPGLGLHMLKIEIGGDGQSGAGSEPAVQHFPEETPTAMRGTQMWLAIQARLRNPNIVLYAIPYSWPGWLSTGQGNPTPFSNPTAPAQYVVTWLQTFQVTASAQGVTNAAVDYVGVMSDVWDAANSPGYIKALRQALNNAGFTSTAIVCADTSDWACATAALADPDLKAAVGVFGSKVLPSDGDAVATGAPLWYSQIGGGWPGNLEWITNLYDQIHNAYINNNLRGVFNFAAASGGYNTLPYFNYGAMRSDNPWTNAFYVTPFWYALAHTTMFTAPGWTHLNTSLGSGFLVNGGSYITRLNGQNAANTLWSTVVAKLGAGTNNIVGEYATFTLGGNILQAAQAYNGSAVIVWTSCFGSTGTNITTMAKSIIPLTKDNQLSLWLEGNCLYTLTTDPNAGTVPNQDRAALPKAFPTQYSDNFQASALNGPGRFWADINGAFEVVNDATMGPGLQQKAASIPVSRRNTDSRPHTILGDPTWRDIDYTVVFALSQTSDNAAICVRCNALNDTAGDSGTKLDNMPGVWLFLNTTGWSLQFGMSRTAPVMRQGSWIGTLPTAVPMSARLIARGDKVIGIFGGIVIFNQDVTWSGPGSSPPTRGFVGLGSGDFGQYPLYASVNINVQDSTCMDMPAVGTIPSQQACQDGAVGQAFTFVPTSGSGSGYFALTANQGLCLHMNNSADPDYRYSRTKAITLQPCDAGDRGQIFTVELTTVDGPFTIGPITGNDGLTMNVYANSEDDDADISGYPWQAGTNAFWYFDGSTGLLYETFMGTCFSLCTRL